MEGKRHNAMKRKILLPLLAVLLLAACNDNTQNPADQKKGSSGKTLELLVVADPGVYAGETKALIDSLFTRPQDGLYNPEAMFDIVNIPLSSYRNTEMFRVHRNILLCDVNSENPGKVYKHIDEYAAPQVIYDFAVKDVESLREKLRKHEGDILDELYKAEHRRVIKAFRGMYNHKLCKAIEEQFGFGLTFSNEFTLAKQDVDFAWVRKEAKDFGIGVLVDVLPYSDSKIFEEQTLLDRIDTIMRRHVPAAAEDSYMGLERRRDKEGYYLAPIFRKTVEFHDSPYCIETRGNWRAFGDFMGGPFVSYALLSPDQKKVIILTGYVYCPRNKPWSKRDLLMQVESICHSLDFDTAE